MAARRGEGVPTFTSHPVRMFLLSWMKGLLKLLAWLLFEEEEIGRTVLCLICALAWTIYRYLRVDDELPVADEKVMTA